MAVSVTLSRVVNDADGSVLVEFSDGTGTSFPTIASMTAWAKEMESKDTAQRLLIAWGLGRSANLQNPNLVTGKTLTFDILDQSQIKVA